MRQPRNLLKTVIEEMFKHISTRQEMHGPTEAFRFKSIKSFNEIVNAQYPMQELMADADAEVTIPGKSIHQASSIMQGSGIPQEAGRLSHNPSHPPLNRICSPIIAEADRLNHDHYNGDGIIDTGNCDEATFVKIGHATMLKLQAVGVVMPVPYTGPAEGPPLYPVPCHIYNEFLQSAEEENNATTDDPSNDIDPALLAASPMPMPMPTPSPTPTTIRNSRRAKEKAQQKIGGQHTQVRKRHGK